MIESLATLVVLSRAAGGAVRVRRRNGCAENARSRPPSRNQAERTRRCNCVATASQRLSGVRPRVLIIGTSLTAGLWPQSRRLLPVCAPEDSRLGGFNAEIVNAGLSGETSAGALRRVDWLLSEPAAVVIMETGANDGLRGARSGHHGGEPARQYVRCVQAKAPAAQDRARADGSAAPTSAAITHAGSTSIFAAVAKETGATLMPFLLDGVAAHPALNQSDGIHPTEAGAKVVAANVWRTLRRRSGAHRRREDE